MGGAAAVLRGRRRAQGFVALAAAAVAYYFTVGSLPDLAVWWDVALLALVLIPGIFLFDWFLLPLARARGLLPLALALGVLAALASVGDLEVLANFAKLAAVTAFAFWFLDFFQELGWVVLVACLVPWVDAYSVWRGPTGDIVENHPQVFTNLSFAFPVPGEHDSANLGLPDLLFFALFLGAAARFRLRVGWTWLAMAAGLGATIAIAVWTELSGLPALPALSLGFLVPNADLLRTRLRRRRTV